ncbi:MAG: class I SAM-dependent methyltransferase [Anaerolineae bacterium]|nr:class I SAM-dependent methyltransferase [Anaerolineae bacterium]
MTKPHADQLAHEYLSKGDPTGWFEVLYANARQGEGIIPWAHYHPHQSLLTWLAEAQPDGSGQRALVIGCGMGDDAEELAKYGFDVTAFDISPTAIDWCKQRWPETTITYVTADLFAPPSEWVQAFDFVLEIYTVQALPIDLRAETTAAIAQFVRPGGMLLAVSRLVDEGVVRHGPPWPLNRAESRLFEQAGLTEVRFTDYVDPGDVRRFRAEYRRDI